MKRVLTFLLLLKLFFIYGQNNKVVYPQGVYSTFQDFINRKPSIENSISAKQGKNMIITTFRIKDGDGNKIKDAFAVSDGENLYVRTNAMLEHLTNSEFNKPNATNKDYSIAKFVNSDHHYFEVFFQNKSVRAWGIGKVYLAGIIYVNSTRKFTFLDTKKDLKIVVGEREIENGNDDDRVNGENIKVARKAISILFKDN
ncbi:hypothetical protein ABN763_12960 [Spongiivirga sp. MCCC 1A20706]|uniref:hypothetical protein n=1 Tax=Spongiivirga sp. MCCC 1A20706 TaxID=3160963 RepID=UPI003977678F